MTQGELVWGGLLPSTAALQLRSRCSRPHCRQPGRDNSISRGLQFTSRVPGPRPVPWLSNWLCWAKAPRKEGCPCALSSELWRLYIQGSGAHQFPAASSLKTSCQPASEETLFSFCLCSWNTGGNCAAWQVMQGWMKKGQITVYPTSGAQCQGQSQEGAMPIHPTVPPGAVTRASAPCSWAPAPRPQKKALDCGDWWTDPSATASQAVLFLKYF